MPEPTTAPESLRERIAMAMAKRPGNIYMDCNDDWYRWLADAVLVELAGDPGDPRERMAAALRAAYNAYGTADRLPQMVSYGTLADAAMSVLPAHAAALAENERLRADNRLMNERLSLGQEGWNELHRESERLRAELAVATTEHAHQYRMAGRWKAERDRLAAELSETQDAYGDLSWDLTKTEAEPGALKAAAERVRALHAPIDHPGRADYDPAVERCRVCAAHADGRWKRFRTPCPTLAALAVPESTACVSHVVPPETTPDAPTGGEDDR